MHISSTVHGLIDPQYDAFDVLKYSFPAGTLSGAPKIRAMEVIDEIESSARGLYGGAIVSIDNQGQMDSCIVIRTIVLKEGLATVRAGAGIVYDSNSQSEADETRHKAAAVLSALKLAEKGLV
jgi:anthranilate synthase component 1